MCVKCTFIVFQHLMFFYLYILHTWIMLYSGRILFFTKLNNKLVLGFQEYEYFCTLSRHKKTHEITMIFIPGFQYIYLFILFYLPHNKYITHGKRRKKKWWGDLTESIGAYERLGLLELRARAVSHQLKKRWRKVKGGKSYELFSYLLNNLIFSFFLKEERDWELMTSLPSELKNLGP